ncbi:MAG: sigma-54 dependent transcriptional regulator [Bacteroidales bacterium]|nr:sigma-54 dependent transcriptional regulator [Bacteroidales bacterium]MCF8455172.1 sigma-54 dependent transcriptional regulator [Bacteroidales bacterium]
MDVLNILVLDDEKYVREELDEFLSLNGFKVFTAGLPSEALQLFDSHDIDLAIFDIKMPETDGLSLLQTVKEKYPHIEIMMISGHGEMESVIEAMRKGAIDYFKKPINLQTVMMAIERTKKYIVVRRKLNQSEQTNSLLKEKLNSFEGVEIISKSPLMDSVLHSMEQVARAKDTSVLITGESGTGKELVAKGIHQLSERKAHAFYAVNCSAIPENLFESEFFGHKKGSFTGATEDKAGWFEVAHKGTLFLDEIGDMPVILQKKLLRVLEERKYTKVGTQKPIDFDIRIIAATNHNIEEQSKGGDFRLDLYHRLSAFVIHIPPLRERKEDIPELLNYFSTMFAAKMNREISHIEDKAIDVLDNYKFPGNVREFKNLVERAVILSEGKTIKAEHFPSILPKNGSGNGHSTEIFDLELNERNLILKALEKSDNNKSQAAKLLNISWNALHRKIAKFQLN